MRLTVENAFSRSNSRRPGYRMPPPRAVVGMRSPSSESTWPTLSVDELTRLERLAETWPDGTGVPPAAIYGTLDPRAEAAAVTGRANHAQRAEVGSSGQPTKRSRLAPVSRPAPAISPNTGGVLQAVDGRAPGYPHREGLYARHLGEGAGAGVTRRSRTSGGRNVLRQPSWSHRPNRSGQRHPARCRQGWLSDRREHWLGRGRHGSWWDR
jgi:hypothetical protein